MTKEEITQKNNKPMAKTQAEKDADYSAALEKRFAEHGNQILICDRNGKWGFIMFYKKIADRKFYCKMWTNGKLVRKYSCIEADSISDILVANKCSYSDDEHPKLPQDKEEYDEYINRRPNIASWNNKLFYPYHQIWNTRLHLEREKLLVQALWSEIRRINRKEEALHHERQEILDQLIPAEYAMVSKFYKIGDIIEDLYGNKFRIESIDKMTFTCRRLDNGKPSKFSVHVLYSQFEPKLW